METFTPKSMHEQILREIALCRFMKIEQINERFFSRGSKNWARVYVNELIKYEYIKVLDTRIVGNRYLYGLDRRGVQFLRKTGMDIRYYPSEHESISGDQLPHLLYTNNIVIASAKLPSILPSFQVIMVPESWTGG